MPLDTWFAFVLASAALLVISLCWDEENPTAFATVPSVALGDLTSMSVSLSGAGAVLAASALLLTVLKFLGAVSLLWLGYKPWCETPSLKSVSGTSVKSLNATMFIQAYTVTALNPKSIIF